LKIVTVGAMTDTHTQTDRQTDASDLIICPMLCYSNGTDNNEKYFVCTLCLKNVPTLKRYSSKL